MKPTVSRTLGAIPPVRKALMLPSLALATVMARDGSTVYASSDHLFKGAIFGRDSLEVAEDLIYMKPRLVHNILLTLGGLQGRQYRAINEEEPGKIVHEFRSRIVDDKPLRGQLGQLFETLNNQWGGDGNVLIYYASVDATVSARAPYLLQAIQRRNSGRKTRQWAGPKIHRARNCPACRPLVDPKTRYVNVGLTRI